MNTKNHIKQHILLSISLLIIGAATAGCQNFTGISALFSTRRPAEGGLKIEQQTIGSSVEKRPIKCVILSQGPQTTFILSTIHGDEQAGTKLVRQLQKYLKKNSYLLLGRKVVLLPVANPDGLAHNTRVNAHGIDLNRNFATANRLNSNTYRLEGLSEPETRAIQKLITKHKPQRIISIHQPYACIDYDGPAKNMAYQMAKLTDLPVKKLGALPGSLGSFAGSELNIPVITLELKPDDHKLNGKTIWKRYGKALLIAITYPDAAKTIAK